MSNAPTKEEARYQNPKFCCACKSFLFSNGYWFCKTLATAVHETGCCDFYVEDGALPPEGVLLKSSRECVNCTHYDNGLCVITYDKAKKVCSEWSGDKADKASMSPEITETMEVMSDETIDQLLIEDDSVVIEQELSCANCQHSYMKENGVPWCAHWDGGLNPADLSVCENYAGVT